MCARVIYVSYDGLTDPLGMSQVVAYMKPLAKVHAITILSFEKASRYEQYGDMISSDMAQAGIHWVKLEYTKTPAVLSTIKDIRLGRRELRQEIEKGADVVHCRGHIAGLIGLPALRSDAVKFIFDLRGWMADEMKESGRWSGPLYNLVYHFFKRKEKQMITEADKVVSLTRLGAKYITDAFKLSIDKIGVIPTCVDFNVFPPFESGIRSEVRSALGLDVSTQVMLYAGSVGGNYPAKDLINCHRRMQECYRGATLLILSKDGVEVAQEALRPHLNPSDNVIVDTCGFRDVHKYIMASDIGLVLYSEGFSTIGRSPTKLGEYWACGIPVLINSGIGDVNELLSKNVGMGLEFPIHLGPKSEQFEILDAYELEESKVNLRKAARAHFSLEKGVEFYSTVYDSLKY